MTLMGRLLDNANQILETAELGDASFLTILMRDGRPAEFSTTNDWAPEMLLHEKQADEVYRVTRSDESLVVEGYSRREVVRLTKRQNILQMGNGWGIMKNDGHNVEAQQLPVHVGPSGVIQSRSQEMMLLFNSYCTVR